MKKDNMLEQTKLGRPKKEVDGKLVKDLASIFCTMNEIAAVVGCSVDTLERRYAEALKRGRETAKSSLRRLQWKAAKKGNTSILIWLGKNYLGQREPSMIPQEADTKIVELMKLVGMAVVTDGSLGAGVTPSNS